MFQKNLVVWKHKEIEEDNTRATRFQKNLVVWKHIKRIQKVIAISIVSEELSSVET